MPRQFFRASLLTAAAGLVLACGASAQAKDTMTGEQKLAKMLEGRVAEKPVNCISILIGDNETTVIDKTAVVYGWGDVIYVNRPTNADQLNSDEILISHPTNDENCSIDTIELRDRYTHTYDGFVGLQQFVPYRRVRKPQS